MSTVKKRFVAGAVCPRCGVLDRIRVYRWNDILYQECAACDFSAQMTGAATASSDSPSMRDVDHIPATPTAGPPDTQPSPAEPIKIVDSGHAVEIGRAGGDDPVRRL